MQKQTGQSLIRLETASRRQRPAGSTRALQWAGHGDGHHPFHLHVNPSQVISRNGWPESQRRWKDTVLVKAGEEVRLRVTFRDCPGCTVDHCHNLDHGDMELMGAANWPALDQR